MKTVVIVSLFLSLLHPIDKSIKCAFLLLLLIPVSYNFHSVSCHFSCFNIFSSINVSINDSLWTIYVHDVNCHREAAILSYCFKVHNRYSYYYSRKHKKLNWLV